jgi:putative phage-type endonuclease
MDREEFLQTRRTGIGGSDVAAIMGISRFKTPGDVFRSKVQGVASGDNEAMFIGRWLEPFVLDMYAEKRGVTVERVEGVLRHPDHPELLANLDGRVSDSRRIVEAKTAYDDRDWGEDGSADIPPDYFCQVQHYMMVTGFEVADVPVFFRGNRANTFRIYTVEADPTFQQDIKEVCLKFWADTMAGLEPWPVTFEEMQANWTARVMEKGGEVLPATPETIEQIGKLRAIRQDIATLEEVRDELTRSIKKDMNTAEALVHDGRNLITWKLTKPRTTFDTDLFKAEQPELYAKYLRESSPHRVFLLK